MDFELDRDAVRKAVSEILVNRGGENEWCVACGAGAAAAPLDLPGPVKKQLEDKAVVQQLLDAKALRELAAISGGETEWCVACGAGAAASPADLVTNPADVSDAMIDELSRALIPAIRAKN